jgi:hypothetical protein
MADLAREIAECISVDAQPTFAGPRRGEIRESIGDASKASLEIGFVASVDLKPGLNQTTGAI